MNTFLLYAHANFKIMSRMYQRLGHTN